MPVKVKDEATVGACAAGDAFAGVCVSCRDGFAAVQLNGYCRVKYSGTKPQPGYAVLGADGSGNVKTVTTGGRSILVTDTDSVSQTIGIIL